MDSFKPNVPTQAHIWVPCLYRFSGGIQTYSVFLIEAFDCLDPKPTVTVCSKHDVQRLADAKHSIHGTGAWPPSLRALAFAAKLIKFGILHRPHFILSTHLNFIPIAYWLKRIAGIPYWVVAHGIEAWDLKNPTLQRALQQADRILPVSHYTRDRLLAEQHLDPAKLSVLPNTFGADRFQIGPKPNHLMERYHLTAQQRVILTVSRLSSQEGYKGYDQIIRALPYIRQQVPDVHYLLVGKGDDRPRLEQLIATLKLQDCVTLAGFVPDNELCDHYNLCDVFAMPSQGEGFGIVYLEALACGKPTLGGNRDGAIDALCQGLLGALVNPDDVNEIAIALAQMLQQTYAHPLMYQPDLLREKVIEIYGFQRFTQTLGHYLEIFRP
jgi:glycosyltransferase involved in cell wall biosynthesis